MANSFQEDKIEKIEKIGLDKSAGLAASAQDQIASESRVKFDEALAKADPTRIKVEALPPQPIQEVASKPSLLDVAGAAQGKTQTDATSALSSVSPPTPLEVLDRAELTKQKFTNAIDLIKQNIDAPIQPSQRASMAASIQHADRYLNQAVGQATGVETKSAIDLSERPPLMRFLNFLTEGQQRLDSLISGIQGLDLSRNKLTPETLLGVQIRLGFVQTELEFFTNILNKSLESTKTIMNVQI